MGKGREKEIYRRGCNGIRVEEQKGRRVYGYQGIRVEGYVGKGVRVRGRG